MSHLTRRTRRLSIGAVMACGLLLAPLAPVAEAQDDVADPVDTIDLEPVPNDQVIGPFKIDDGNYAGVVTQSLRLSLTGRASVSTINLEMSRDGSGTTSFSVTDEVLTGEWSMSDSGGLTELGRPGFIEGESVGSASGTISGSFPYTFTGVFISDSSATVDVAAVGGAPVGAQTATSSEAQELSFELSEVVQVCGQVQANWDASFRDLYTDLGIDVFPRIKTQLVAFPTVDGEAIQQRLVELVDKATRASNQITTAEDAVVGMIEVVLLAEELMSDIEGYPETCPDTSFLRIINQVLRDMMNSLLDNWASQDQFPRALTLRRLVEVGHRAGVLGSGSADPQAAEFLTEKITSTLQDSYDQAIESGDWDELGQLVATANMFGYELAEASLEDLCIVFGEC